MTDMSGRWRYSGIVWPHLSIALTYRPVIAMGKTHDKMTLDEIAGECERILNTESNDNLDYLFAMGGSSGGARPTEKRKGYFGTRRFDRRGEGEDRKVHMVSAAGLLETSHRIPDLDYDILMKLTLQLTKDMSECEKLYRLMWHRSRNG